MHIVLVIQSKCNSTKLPYKIIKNLTDNKSLIEHVIERCQRSTIINQIIVNTTINHSDNKLVSLLENKQLLNKVSLYRGSETNVLERTYQAGAMCRADIIVRVMANMPFIDPELIDTVVKFFTENNYNYMFFGDRYHFPDGFAFDIFQMSTLRNVWQKANDPYDLQHVSSYIRNNKDTYQFYQYNILNPNPIHFEKSKYPNINFEKLSLGVRSSSDFEYIKGLYNTIYQQNPNFKIQDVLEFLNQNPDRIHYQKYEDENNISIYEGKGQELSVIANKIIPKGCSDITKNSDSYLPYKYPSYYINCNGIHITTLDGNKLKDFGNMSGGSCVLGYNDPDVATAVHNVIERGNLSSLNNPSEVKLAKELLTIHPWASFAKFTKSESNALSLAIKLARASTGKHKILVNGMMSWHDTFMASNLKPVDAKYKSKDPCNVHFDNLKVYGVHPKLVDSCIVFNTQSILELERLIKKQYNEIGCLIMEPVNVSPLGEIVLKKIQKMCHEYNIKFILNEIKYGFRNNVGGLHLNYNDITPDLCVLGRAMSNGYSLSAVIGNSQLMPIAQTTYASDMCWSDSIGIDASITAIHKFKELSVYKNIKSVGRYFQENITKLAEIHQLQLKVSGIPTLTQFNFNYKDTDTFNNYSEFDNGIHKLGNLNNLLRTLYIQMMLQYNILADMVFYPSYCHTFKEVDYYLKHIDIVFKELKKGLDTKKLHKLLNTIPATKSYIQLH